MKKEELIKKVEFVSNDRIEKMITIFVTTNSTGPQLFNIIKNDLDDLTEMFTKSVKALILDKEFVLEDYSTSLKRSDVLHIYDLDDNRTDEMKRMAEVVEIQNPDYFDKSVTKIENINGIYIIIKDIDNKNIITLFKNITNVDKAYAASTFLVFCKADKQFERQKENMLRITPQFHMMLVDGKVVLVDLDKLEKPLHLDAILQKETERNVKTLSKDLVVAHEHLMNVCKKPSLCKKLRHALTASKVIKKLEDGSLTSNQIIEFVTTKTNLKFHYNKAKTKFELRNNAEAERFIKLMDDDYLLSELTGEKYDSKDKDILAE